jgi:hypothetical protein
MGKCDAGGLVNPKPGIVGPAVDEGVAHAARYVDRKTSIAPRRIEESRYAAHEQQSYESIEISSLGR